MTGTSFGARPSEPPPPGHAGPHEDPVNETTAAAAYLCLTAITKSPSGKPVMELPGDIVALLLGGGSVTVEEGRVRVTPHGRRVLAALQCL